MGYQKFRVRRQQEKLKSLGATLSHRDLKFLNSQGTILVVLRVGLRKRSLHKLFSPATLFTIPCLLYTLLVWCGCVSHSVVPDSLRPIDYSPPGSSVHGILQARSPANCRDPKPWSSCGWKLDSPFCSVYILEKGTEPTFGV